MNRTLRCGVVWLICLCVDSFRTHCGSMSWTYWSFFPRETNLVCMCSWWFQSIWKMVVKSPHFRKHRYKRKIFVQPPPRCICVSYIYIYIYRIYYTLCCPSSSFLALKTNSNAKRGSWMTLQKEVLMEVLQTLIYRAVKIHSQTFPTEKTDWLQVLNTSLTRFNYHPNISITMLL